MERSGNHILSLVNEVLNIAQFEDDKVTLLKQHIILSDLLGSLKDKYIEITTKPVRFNINTQEADTIYADLHYISEAINNIIDNAIKYSKENQDAEINVSSSLKGNYIQIVFRDNGIGISEKDQQRIFDKFERSMSVIENKNKVSGFGLGLNFVYQVIKAHKGTIRANSKLGSFSEFIINLPNKDENDKTVIS
jgi:two-component system phosphate regulon sensor histidine kinase PhoR